MPGEYMVLFGNILWFLLGGFVMGLAWWMFGVLAFISIIGIPWARACFVLGAFAFFPFGKDVIRRDMLTGQDDIGTGAFGTVGNIIWLALAGIWLAIGHLASAAVCAVTIIGLPFAWQHVKLASLALWPIGRTVVSADLAAAARQAHAREEALRLREGR